MVAIQPVLDMLSWSVRLVVIRTSLQSGYWKTRA